MLRQLFSVTQFLLDITWHFANDATIIFTVIHQLYQHLEEGREVTETMNESDYLLSLNHQIQKMGCFHFM